MKNIVIFSHKGNFYGAPRSIFEIGCELKQLGYKVTFLVPEQGELTENLNKKNIPYRVLNNPSWIYSPRKKEYSKFLFFKHLIKLRINLLFDFFRLYRSYKKAFNELNPDLVIINTVASPLPLIYAKRLKKKSVLWMRETILNKNGFYVPLLVPKFVAKKVLNRASMKIVPSNFLEQFYNHNFDFKDIHVINDSVDLNLKNNNTSTFNKNQFGLVGLVNERKGQIQFMRTCLNRNKQACIHVFGGISPEVQNEVTRLKEEFPANIQLHAYTNDQEFIYTSFSIYVNMGIDESFGRTTIEAMRAGKLVFGKKSGATTELIQDSWNGFLFDSVEEIFSILGKLTDEDIQRIIENAIEYSLEFTPFIVTNNFIVLTTKNNSIFNR